MITEKYTIIDDEVSVKIAGSAMESLRAKRVKRTGLRVYRDGLIGVSGYMGEEGEAAALERASAALAHKVPYPCAPEAGFERSQEEGGKPFTAGALDAEAAAVLAALKKDFPQFIFSSSGIKSGTTSVALKNDAGLDLASSVTSHSFGMMYKLASSAGILDGWFSTDGPVYERAAYLAYASEMLSAQLNPVPLPSEGKLPVFFEDGDQLVRNIFVRELDGMTFGAGGSLFSGKTGRTLFSDGLTLFNGRARNDLPFFDAEGLRGEGFMHIADGVLKAPYCDKKAAAKYGFRPSGHAYAAYDGAPATGSSGLTIKPQDKTVKEMLGGQPAVYVSVASGGDFTSEGAFGTPAQVAFLMKDGRLVGRLPELQLSSHVYDMYGKDFLGVSADTIMPLTRSRWLGFLMEVKKG